MSASGSGSAGGGADDGEASAVYSYAEGDEGPYEEEDGEGDYDADDGAGADDDGGDASADAGEYDGDWEDPEGGYGYDDDGEGDGDDGGESKGDASVFGSASAAGDGTGADSYGGPGDSTEAGAAATAGTAAGTAAGETEGQGGEEPVSMAKQLDMKLAEMEAAAKEQAAKNKVSDSKQKQLEKERDKAKAIAIAKAAAARVHMDEPTSRPGEVILKRGVLYDRSEYERQTGEGYMELVKTADGRICLRIARMIIPNPAHHAIHIVVTFAKYNRATVHRLKKFGVVQNCWEGLQGSIRGAMSWNGELFQELEMADAEEVTAVFLAKPPKVKPASTNYVVHCGGPLIPFEYDQKSKAMDESLERLVKQVREVRTRARDDKKELLRDAEPWELSNQGPDMLSYLGINATKLSFDDCWKVVEALAIPTIKPHAQIVYAATDFTGAGFVHKDDLGVFLVGMRKAAGSTARKLLPLDAFEIVAKATGSIGGKWIDYQRFKYLLSLLPETDNDEARSKARKAFEKVEKQSGRLTKPQFLQAYLNVVNVPQLLLSKRTPAMQIGLGYSLRDTITLDRRRLLKEYENEARVRDKRIHGMVSQLLRAQVKPPKEYPDAYPTELVNDERRKHRVKWVRLMMQRDMESQEEREKRVAARNLEDTLSQDVKVAEKERHFIRREDKKVMAAIRRKEVQLELAAAGTNTIDESWKGLRDVPSEFFTGKNAIERLGIVVMVTLEGNELECLPDQIPQDKEALIDGRLSDIVPLKRDRTKRGKMKKAAEMSADGYLKRSASEASNVMLFHMSKLQRLDLGRNKLRVLPKALKYLIALKVLRLTQNDLTFLPEEVGTLENLVLLDVSHNSLDTLPASIGALTALTSLNAAANQITELPDIPLPEVPKKRKMTSRARRQLAREPAKVVGALLVKRKTERDLLASGRNTSHLIDIVDETMGKAGREKRLKRPSTSDASDMDDKEVPTSPGVPTGLRGVLSPVMEGHDDDRPSTGVSMVKFADSLSVGGASGQLAGELGGTADAAATVTEDSAGELEHDGVGEGDPARPGSKGSSRSSLRGTQRDSGTASGGGMTGTGMKPPLPPSTKATLRGKTPSSGGRPGSGASASTNASSEAGTAASKGGAAEDRAESSSDSDEDDKPIEISNGGFKSILAGKAAKMAKAAKKAKASATAKANESVARARSAATDASRAAKAAATEGKTRAASAAAKARTIATPLASDLVGAARTTAAGKMAEKFAGQAKAKADVMGLKAKADELAAKIKEKSAEGMAKAMDAKGRAESAASGARDRAVSAKGRASEAAQKMKDGARGMLSRGSGGSQESGEYDPTLAAADEAGKALLAEIYDDLNVKGFGRPGTTATDAGEDAEVDYGDHKRDDDGDDGGAEGHSVFAVKADPRIEQAGVLLPALLKLDLSLNHLTRLPMWLAGLTSLYSLNVSGNEIQTLSTQLGGYPALEALDLRANNFEEHGLLQDSRDYDTGTAMDVAVFTSLRSLLLSRADLVILPRAVRKMTRLLHVDLSRNKLVHLPDEIGDMPHLEILQLENNKLRDVPMTMGWLTSLVSLTMQGNHIKVIPEEFGALRMLRFWDASFNHIESFPESLRFMTGLTELHLSHNRIPKIAHILRRLDKLTLLDVSFNQLTALPDTNFPPRLRTLHAHRNAIREIPMCMCSVRSLTHVDLSTNRIKVLPAEIHKLHRLRTLDISYNKIDDVPLDLAPLLASEERPLALHVSGNPMKGLHAAGSTWDGGVWRNLDYEVTDGHARSYVIEQAGLRVLTAEVWRVQGPIEHPRKFVEIIKRLLGKDWHDGLHGVVHTLHNQLRIRDEVKPPAPAPDAVNDALRAERDAMKRDGEERTRAVPAGKWEQQHPNRPKTNLGMWRGGDAAYGVPESKGGDRPSLASSDGEADDGAMAGSPRSAARRSGGSSRLGSYRSSRPAEPTHGHGGHIGAGSAARAGTGAGATAGGGRDSRVRGSDAAASVSAGAGAGGSRGQKPELYGQHGWSRFHKWEPPAPSTWNFMRWQPNGSVVYGATETISRRTALFKELLTTVDIVDPLTESEEEDPELPPSPESPDEGNPGPGGRGDSDGLGYFPRDGYRDRAYSGAGSASSSRSRSRR